ncbi:rhomboid family intramembrane serine protease [Marinifilum caeruleilacunae]|uniref:Rhomboid family intramembrane serine protease n=1 Tax=Marinifilum caeruleilacunae TaxID=2499076 RepID=A0ABX1WS30_9BACT|nr:rhomboid family intramembrane serine protease [Marinifilum caeruleilacunae]NOU58904.1 rhomboid family intramembrane serine protease [Marinifilum caeruleilacunae]
MTQYRPPLLNLPPVVKNLLIINVILLLATYVVQSKFGIDLKQHMGLYYPGSDFFRPHQIFTHMFMHGDLTHLFFNMFALFMFGRVLESVWGPKRFLSFYLITGLGAAFLHLLVSFIEYKVAISSLGPEQLEYFKELAAQGKYIPGTVSEKVTSIMYAPTVGASGAVFGILLGFGMLFPNTELMLIFPPIPIKAKYFVIGYGAIELYLAFLNRPGDNIAHFAHLGGMIFGYILIKYWQKNSNRFY